MRLLFFLLRIDFSWCGLKCVKFNALWGKCFFSPPHPFLCEWNSVWWCSSCGLIHSGSLRCWGSWLVAEFVPTGSCVLWADVLGNFSVNLIPHSVGCKSQWQWVTLDVAGVTAAHLKAPVEIPVSQKIQRVHLTAPSTTYYTSLISNFRKVLFSFPKLLGEKQDESHLSLRPWGHKVPQVESRASCGDSMLSM